MAFQQQQYLLKKNRLNSYMIALILSKQPQPSITTQLPTNLVGQPPIKTDLFLLEMVEGDSLRPTVSLRPKKWRFLFQIICKVAVRICSKLPITTESRKERRKKRMVSSIWTSV